MIKVKESDLDELLDLVEKCNNSALSCLYYGRFDSKPFRQLTEKIIALKNSFGKCGEEENPEVYSKNHDAVTRCMQKYSVTQRQVAAQMKLSESQFSRIIRKLSDNDANAMCQRIRRIAADNVQKTPNEESGLMRGTQLRDYVNMNKVQRDEIAKELNISPEAVSGLLSRCSKNNFDRTKSAIDTIVARRSSCRKTVEVKEVPSSAIANEEKTFITLQLNDNSEFPVTDNMVSIYKTLYPAVNIEQQLRKMKGWCMTNPKKRKTKNGIHRFINNWLSREQDNGGYKRT